MPARPVLAAAAVAALLLGVAAPVSAATPSAAVPSAKVYKACANKKTGAVRLVVKGRKCGRSELRLRWNASGPAGAVGTTGAPGAEGPTGPQGPAGATGATGPTALLVSGEFTLDPSGIQGVARGIAGNTSSTTLTPGTQVSAAHLGVRVNVAPGAGKRWTFTVRVNGVFSPLSCVIADQATTCVGAGPLVIPPASEVDMMVVSSGDLPNTAMEWSLLWTV